MPLAPGPLPLPFVVPADAGFLRLPVMSASRWCRWDARQASLPMANRSQAGAVQPTASSLDSHQGAGIRAGESTKLGDVDLEDMREVGRRRHVFARPGFRQAPEPPEIVERDVLQPRDQLVLRLH